MKVIIIAVGVAAIQLASGAADSIVSGTVSDNKASSGVVFTNSNGQTFSVEDLATQLKNLRSAVDQTMPVLSAFTQSYSNSTPGGKTLTGKLSDFVSGALDKNNQNSGSSSQTSATVSNTVSALRGLLNRNSSAATASSTPSSVDANMIRQLSDLQHELQPVLPTLQQLNVESTGSSTSTLSPTGR